MTSCKKKIILFLLCVLILSIFSVLYFYNNTYKYPVHYYDIEDAKQLFNNYKSEMIAVRDLLLKNDELFNSREEDTSEVVIYDCNLKGIKKYFHDEEFDELLNFFDKTGVCFITRRFGTVYYTFILNGDNTEFKSCTVYYIPREENIIYYSQHYTEFIELSDGWYYGIH